MTEGSRRSDPRAQERRRAARRNLIIALIGFAIAAPALFLELSPAMEIRFRLAGTPLMVLATALGAVTDRNLLERFITFAILVGLAIGVAREINNQGGLGIDLINAALIVVFFVLPIPLVLTHFQSRRDELQRSLMTNAAGVAFLATLFGSIGFTVLDAIGGLDPLPPVAVPIFAVGTWVVAWVSLRWRFA